MTWLHTCQRLRSCRGCRMRVIVAGSRSGVTAHDVGVAITLAVNSWDQDTPDADWPSIDVTEVVSGGAAGADAYGEAWAREHDIPVKRFPADWNTHGRAAGPIRNRQMAEYADALVAVWDGKSRGTANMIREADKRGLKVYVYRVDLLRV